LWHARLSSLIRLNSMARDGHANTLNLARQTTSLSNLSQHRSIPVRRRRSAVSRGNPKSIDDEVALGRGVTAFGGCGGNCGAGRCIAPLRVVAQVGAGPGILERGRQSDCASMIALGRWAGKRGNLIKAEHLMRGDLATGRPRDQSRLT